MKKTIMTLAILCGLSGHALAQSASSEMAFLGSFGDWEAYAYEDNGNKVCFMAASPTDTQSSNPSARRSESHLYITHWSMDDKKNIVSVTPGYTPDGDIKLDIDGKSSSLPSEAETAWTGSTEEDDRLTAALQKGTKAVVKAQSKRGTKTTDSYSLKGSADAYKAISEACGV